MKYRHILYRIVCFVKFASNANLHKFAYFHSFVTISETAKMLVGGIPPTP